MSGAARRDRLWIAIAVALLLAGLGGRIHNAFAYPALRDFDGAGHALNVFAIYRGELPHPESWSGFHPPLAHALGAAVWRIAPDAIPVHSQLRLLSALYGALALVLVYRVLRRRLETPDAALAVAVAWCAPVTAIATSMIGNEMLCALLVTATLAWLLREPGARGVWVHAAVAGLLAGVSVLAKTTGLLAVAAVAVHYAFSLRGRPSRALGVVALAVVVALGVATPHFARLANATGSSALAAVSGGAISPDARGAMLRLPPGEREIGDYFSFPSATLLAPLYLDPDLVRSVPGLLYASTWADGHAQFLAPGRGGAVLRAESLIAIAGLVPTGLAMLGVVALARRREWDWLGPCAFLALLGLAFLRYAWDFPQYATIKASYFLPALLPATYLLGRGLTHFEGGTRQALRGWLALLAAGATGVFWYGWWS